MDTLLYGEHFGGDILAVAAPGEGGHIAFPAEFDVLAGAAHEGVGKGVVGDGELEFVAVQAVDVAARLEAALNHLALVGFEEDAFALEIVDVAGVDAAAVDEEEAEVDKDCECQEKDEADDGDDFRFA